MTRKNSFFAGILACAALVGCAGPGHQIASVPIPTTRVTFSTEEIGSISWVRTNKKTQVSETIQLSEKMALVKRAGVSFSPKEMPLKEGVFSGIVTKALDLDYPADISEGDTKQELIFEDSNAAIQKVALPAVMGGTLQQLYQDLMAIRQKVLSQEVAIER